MTISKQALELIGCTVEDYLQNYIFLRFDILNLRGSIDLSLVTFI